MTKKKISKEYINGFKHGIKWAEIWLGLKVGKNIDEFYKAVNQAVKSLKEGR